MFKKLAQTLILLLALSPTLALAQQGENPAYRRFSARDAAAIPTPTSPTLVNQYYNGTAFYFKKSDGSSVAIGGGGGGTPGGADTQVQFNDGGAFGGDAGLTYNKTTDLLTGVGFSGTSVVVRGSGSGAATITAPAAAGSPSIVLPTVNVTGFTALPGTNGRAVVMSTAGALSVATGTPDGTKFLRDDGSYQVPTFTMSYPLAGSSGSEGAPTYSFSGANSDNGLYLQADDTPAITVAGTRRFTWSTVEITTTLPIIASTDNALDSGSSGGSWRSVYADTSLILTGDVILSRDAANSLQLGADAGTASAQTIKAADSTSGVGANLQLGGGNGSTTNAGGSTIIGYYPASSDTFTAALTVSPTDVTSTLPMRTPNIEGSTYVAAATGGTYKVVSYASEALGGLALASDITIKFSSTTNAVGSKDTGIKRFGVSELQVTDGSTGAGLLRASGFKALEVSANPSAADLTSGADAKDRLQVYMKADKLVFAYNNAGTVTYITLDLDGSDTTWTHGTSAP